MTALFDDFASFQRNVGKLEAAVNQTRGAYKEVLGRLKKEFGAADLKAAKKKLERMRKKELYLTQTHLKDRQAFVDELRQIRKEIEECVPDVLTLLDRLIADTERLLPPRRKKGRL